MNEPLAVTAWSAISPFGSGPAEFAAGLLAGRATAQAPSRERWAVDDVSACLVPDFDVRKALGDKKVRAMNRASGLAVVTAADLLARLAEHPDGVDTTGEHTAVVLGTTTGSVASMMGLTRASLVGERPDHIEPALVPYCVMNCAAGQVAIWHQIKGPNATIAAGRNTGPHALNYARRLLVTGRARRVLCGAVEEFSADRSLLERCARGGAQPTVPLGEGCAMVALETLDAVTARGDRPLATVLGFGSGTGPVDDVRTTTLRAVGGLLRTAGIAPADVHTAVASSADAGQDTALRDVFGGPATGRVRLSELIGDTASAAGLFALVALLAMVESDPSIAETPAVIASSDDDGAVSCVLVVPHVCSDAGSDALADKRIPVGV